MKPSDPQSAVPLALRIAVLECPAVQMTSVLVAAVAKCRNMARFNAMN